MASRERNNAQLRLPPTICVEKKTQMCCWCELTPCPLAEVLPGQMFGVSGPHKRGALGPSTESRNDEEEFEPDSQASRDFEARRKMIKAGKQFEKAPLTRVGLYRCAALLWIGPGGTEVLERMLSMLSVVASPVVIDTQLRIRDLRRASHDPNSLASRRLFLQLLAMANLVSIWPALGLILDAKFHSIFGDKDDTQWQHVALHRCFDYVISSFPTLVWCSMLSVLLLHLIEMHLTSRRLPAIWTCWRPFIALGNLLAYALYAACAAATFPRRYAEFRHSVYFLLGCTHVLLLSGLVYFAYRVRRQIRELHGIESVRRRIWLLGIVPATEFVRTVNDFQYSLGFLPFNLNSGFSSLVFLALAKLFLEWLPSVCILLVFRPLKTSHSSDLRDDLIDPLMPSKAYDHKPDLESSEGSEEEEDDTRGTLGPPDGIPWSLRVGCGSPRFGLTDTWQPDEPDEPDEPDDQVLSCMMLGP
eukprot:s32_g40.t1